MSSQPIPHQPQAPNTRPRWPLVALALAALLAACTPPIQPMPDGTPVPDAVGPMPVVTLDQGWDQRTQLAFWFSTQGSQIVPYAWFLALEQAGSTDLFRAQPNIERLGYLPAKPGPGSWNPDGLPVGFVKTAGSAGGDWVGLTCAACHTSQVNYKGVGLRIDGGPSMADFNLFFGDLVAALAATRDDAAKFERFAQRVQGAASPAQRQTLREALARQAADSGARLKLNQPTNAPGHARLDAFGNIFNEVLVVALAQPGNAKPPDAPVSYPFLWDTPQHDVVQWNGSAPNGPFGLGELSRNIGEVLGVFGGLRVDDCNRDRCHYPSNVDVRQLGQLEGWVRSLWSPQWSTRYLGAIDGPQAQRGQALYNDQCLRCHALIDRKDPFRRITAMMNDVGTDPGMATAAATRMASTGPLQGTIDLPKLQRYGATAGGGPLLVQGAVGVLLSDRDAALLALISQFEAQVADEQRDRERYPPPLGHVLVRPTLERLQRALDNSTALPAATAAEAIAAPGPVVSATYKARPLNGIWATAPYLHNGSVPTLWELLRPPAQRVRSFQVGSREFDPVNVGFDISQGPYRFDTSLPGNSNQGHDYGSALADAQKRQLIEYLKTL